MNNNKITILFLIHKIKVNQQGKSPLRCRLTYKGKRKIFSTGLFIKPEHWQNSKQKAHPPNEENTFINSQLSLIKNNINQAFLFLQLQKDSFTVEQIYKQYAGETQDEDKTLLDAFNYHNNRLKKLVGIDISHKSWEKYNETKNHISDFLWFKYKKKDMLLKEVNLNFLSDYEFYLKTEKKHMPSTVYKNIQRVRRILTVAVAMDYLPKDPFMLYKAKKPKKEILYLTVDELNKLEIHKFVSVRLKQVRDMFVFCCYTGLAYQEMANLKHENIVIHNDKSIWIEMYRQKTQRKFVVPMLKQAINIMNMYKTDETLLPVISNQRFNSYLKEIADIVGINKNLTHHLARKTFATTVLLYNDVPMEIVSELLGHSKISVTQEHYAKVMQSKLSEHISKLGKKLK